LLLLLAAAGGGEASDVVVRRCLQLLWQGDVEGARESFAPGYLSVDASDLLDEIHRNLQLGGQIEMKRLGHTVHGPGPLEGAESLLYHVRGEEGALLVFAQTVMDGSSALIMGIHWEVAPLDLRDRFPFVWTGVSPLHYLVLAASVTVPLFMLYALGLCVLRRPPLWWLWIPFILVGVSKFSVVWTPGPLGDEHVGFVLRSLQLLGVSLVKSPPYEPWVLGVSFPLGAFLFLVRYVRGGPWTLADGDDEVQAG
jgi:hypothetical protein